MMTLDQLIEMRARAYALYERAVLATDLTQELHDGLSRYRADVPNGDWACEPAFLLLLTRLNEMAELRTADQARFANALDTCKNCATAVAAIKET